MEKILKGDADVLRVATLTEERRSLGLSLGKCAAAVGLSTVALSKIERGSDIPTDEQCERIGTVLNLSVSEVRCRLPSKEDTERISQRTIDSLLAMAACHEDAQAKGFEMGHGGRGHIVCPIDGGTLHYSVATVNGHLWGACSNTDCVRWMQ